MIEYEPNTKYTFTDTLTQQDWAVMARNEQHARIKCARNLGIKPERLKLAKDQ